MKKEMSETALIFAIKKQIPSAVPIFYDRYALTLFKVIYCSCKHPGINCIVLEQTMLAIWSNIEDYNAEEDNFLLWMAGIARALAKESVTSFQVQRIRLDSTPLVVTTVDV